ncbi:MAG: hypothetical protein H7339_13055 [Arcicella sp.]|nr:hypothetical protein [Arcicella sp.]
MKIILVLFSLFLLFACDNINSNLPPPQDGGKFFYPKIGQSVVYDVEETEYELTGKFTLKTYQLKEVNVSTFNDLDGKKAMRIERYRRENDAQKWTIDSIFTAKKEVDKVLKIENNVTYIKMSFPMKEGLKWNGNAYNSFGNDSYEMKKVNQLFQINGQKFSNSVTVVQQNDSTLVDLKRRREVYSEGIGLIYQEKINVSYCNSADCLGKGKIDFGTKHILKFKNNE